MEHVATAFDKTKSRLRCQQEREGVNGLPQRPSPGVTYTVAVPEATIAETYKEAVLVACLGAVKITV